MTRLTRANGFSAPVCPISRSGPKPLQPGILIQSAPKASDLPSLINAVNILNQSVQFLYMPQVTNQIIGVPGTPVIINNTSTSTEANPATKGPGQINMNWVEIERDYEIVRLHNPRVDSEYVDVERISHLKFADFKHQTIWEWWLDNTV